MMISGIVEIPYVFATRVENLRIWDSQSFYHFQYVFRLVAYRYTDNFHSFVSVTVVKRNQFRNLFPAWSAPRCPEIHNDIFALAYIV